MDFSWITEFFQPIAKQVLALVLSSGVILAIWAWLRWARTKRKLRPSDGAQFTLLVAELAGDADRTQTNHILVELEKQFPPRGEARLHVLLYPEVLKLGPGERAAALQAAEERGRRWLKDKNADVLIWGEVGAKDKVLRLRFLTHAFDSGGQKPYEMNSALELPLNFGADLGAVLAAQADTAISAVYDQEGEASAALLLPIVTKLRPLAENPPSSFSDQTRAKLWQAYADGEQRLGEELGDNARLATAIAFLKKVLTVRPRNKAPLHWAKTQSDLGSALSTLGARESGTARLEEAIAAFREALKEFTRERFPLDWAATQNDLGNTLQTLGARESGTTRLEEAVNIYREALKEYTRERVPLDWAMTQHNLGQALRRLGARESGTARLEEAVAAYREALKEATPERVPLKWAMTQNNLGTALSTLSERESGTARLEEAVAAFREALKERTRERVPLDWASTQNNLGAALRRLGEWEKGAVRLEEAVAAFREALKERTRERVPLDWASTQNNLGIALVALGKITNRDNNIDDAIKIYRSALEIYTRNTLSFSWALIQSNLGDALRMLGEKRGSTAILQEAIAAYRSAISAMPSIEHYRSGLKRDLRATEQLLAEREVAQ
jgi:tetratricopeptide (TPR) repeat protein